MSTAETAMASLVGSLADNKAALGRRYAEWACPRPTLESAVAAAAMAQDELGHARSTYPVLKALGVERRRGRLRRRQAARAARRRAARLERVHRRQPAGRRRADDVRRRLRGQHVEPMAAAREEDPPGGGLAPRARRGVGAAPAAAATQRDAFVARLRETWEHAGRWLGPDDDPEYAAALEAGEVERPPAHQRELVRAWLDERCSPPRASSSRSPELDAARLGPASAAGGRHDLPVLRLSGRRARRPVGRADHHRPVALQRVQLLLRGHPRGLRRGGANRFRRGPRPPRTACPSRARTPRAR